MEDVVNYGTVIIAAISALAFVVSVITQVTKSIAFFSKIPTQLEVVVLSVIITPAAYIAYAQYNYMQLHWYMIAASIIAAFFVAFVAIFGWEKFCTLYRRFFKN
ncbi:MAG: hypothetical protein V8Q07_05605 [Acutalibacteraceae bacterium]